MGRHLMQTLKMWWKIQCSESTVFNRKFMEIQESEMEESLVNHLL